MTWTIDLFGLAGNLLPPPIWTGWTGTLTPNAAVAPDGTTTAATWSPAAQVYRTVSGTTDGTERSCIWMRSATPGNIELDSNLTDGSSIKTCAVTATWQRFAVDNLPGVGLARGLLVRDAGHGAATVELWDPFYATSPKYATPYKTARLTWAADGAGALEVTLNKAQAESGLWRAGRTRIGVLDSVGKRRYQGWLERLEWQASPSDEKGGGKIYRAASRGLAVILDKRVIHGDFSQVSVVATTAATAILAHIAAQTDDKTNFTVGTITGVAPAVTRYYCDGDIASDAINELGTYFAWEINADGLFDAWVGGRGTDRSGTYTLAPANTTDWEPVEDTTELATYVTGRGDNGNATPCGAPLVVDFNALRTTYGRLETVMDDNTADITVMNDKTTEELRARQATRYSLRTTWIEGHRAPWTFGTVWIGDLVFANLGPAFGGTVKVKCTGITVTLDPGQHEFIEMTWESA